MLTSCRDSTKLLPDYEVDDPIAQLNAAAEITLQRWRAADAARVSREQALTEESTGTPGENSNALTPGESNVGML